MPRLVSLVGKFSSGKTTAHIGWRGYIITEMAIRGLDHIKGIVHDNG